MNAVAPQVFARGLQQPPVSASVVGDVRLYLVISLLVGQEHPFYSRYLGNKKKKKQLTAPGQPSQVC